MSNQIKDIITNLNGRRDKFKSEFEQAIKLGGKLAENVTNKDEKVKFVAILNKIKALPIVSAPPLVIKESVKEANKGKNVNFTPAVVVFPSGNMENLSLVCPFENSKHAVARKYKGLKKDKEYSFVFGLGHNHHLDGKTSIIVKPHAAILKNGKLEKIDDKKFISAFRVIPKLSKKDFKMVGNQIILQKNNVTNVLTLTLKIPANLMGVDAIEIVLEANLYRDGLFVTGPKFGHYYETLKQ